MYYKNKLTETQEVEFRDSVFFFFLLHCCVVRDYAWHIENTLKKKRNTNGMNGTLKDIYVSERFID